MSTIRAFIAVEIDEPHKQKLTTLISRLKTSNADVKWVNENQMHLTLKFLGNIEEKQAEEISEALKSIADNFKGFSINLSNIGCFPNPKRPRVIWVGIDKGKEKLKLLAGQIEIELEKLGFPRENRDFKAHLTLGRVRSNKNLQNLTKLLSDASFESRDEIRIQKLILFQSTLTSKGAVYTILSESALN